MASSGLDPSQSAFLQCQCPSRPSSLVLLPTFSLLCEQPECSFKKKWILPGSAEDNSIILWIPRGHAVKVTSHCLESEGALCGATQR